MMTSPLLVFVGFALPLCAQTIITSGTMAGFTFSFEYETRVEPGGAINLTSRTRGYFTTATEITFDRYLTDSARKTYFGYRVQATAPVAGYTLVSFSRVPMSAEAAKSAGVPNAEEWTYIGLDATATKLVKTGDTVALDLLQNPQTGQRIVERITVGGKGLVSTAPQPVRDFSIGDVQLYFSDPRLVVNGVEESLGIGWPISGNTVSLSRKGKGRYFISLSPIPERNYVLAGEVLGHGLSFKAGSDSIGLYSNTRIAPGKDRYHLYVLFEPDQRAMDTRLSIEVPGR